MTLRSILRPIQIMMGVQPNTDQTAVTTDHFTFSDKIREWNGKPRKIGGWVSIAFDYGQQMAGVIRSIYSDFINGKYYLVVGSNSALYSVIGSRLTNITPLKTTGIPASNTLSTHYVTLGNNPITYSQANLLGVLASTDGILPGDTITLSGVTGNPFGVPDAELNAAHVVANIGFSTIFITTSTTATVVPDAGGNAVVLSSGLIRLSQTNDLRRGARVKISGASNTGGVLAGEINNEFVVRNTDPLGNPDTSGFYFMTSGTATSAVTGGGGAALEYFEEIDAGQVNETNAQGYGAGLYGVGLYGTALVSNTARSYPRIWFSDRYGDTIITTPGNQGGLYQWQGNVSTAPELILNAPTAINYAFVSNNIIVTFGAGGVENRIFASDQNNITEWTSSSVNQVYDDDIEGAGRLISHCPVKDYNLVFTEYKTYILRYIGLPFVWQIQSLDEAIGLIAPMARCTVKGMAFWMGQENFYFYRGGTVEIIPANSQNQSTCLKYVFDNINWGQKSKIFALYNKQYNEVWFHYPSAGSNEPDRVVRVNLLTFSWWIDTMDRTAAEYPSPKLVNPRLANLNTLYQHEYGTDADGQPMAFSIVSDRRYYEKATTDAVRIMPDSNQSGTITFKAEGFLYPQSESPVYSKSYPVQGETIKIEEVNNGRFYEYTWSGSELGQDWLMGTWFEEIQGGSRE